LLSIRFSSTDTHLTVKSLHTGTGRFHQNSGLQDTLPPNLRIFLNLRTTPQVGIAAWYPKNIKTIFGAARRLRQHRRLEFQPETAGWWWGGEYPVKISNNVFVFFIFNLFFRKILDFVKK
jgi:hypothetical protein